MTHLVEFLRKEGLEAVTTKFSVATTRHKKHNQLILFKYDQINSPFENPVVRNCRGIILDEQNDWSIVSYPYDKFFNVGERHAAVLDFKSSVRVTDKLDGSLMTLYYYQGEWHIATSGKPDASGKVRILRQRLAQLSNENNNNNEDTTNDNTDSNVNMDDIDEDLTEQGELTGKDETGNKKGWIPFDDMPTYADVFWAVWKALNYSLPSEEDQDKCFMFEFLSTDARIIVKYDADDIYLHGARNLNTLQEEDPIIYANKYNWKLVPFKEYKSLDEMIKAAAELNPSQAEGFVACDSAFNRLKVKSPNYVQMALLTLKDKEGLNERRMLKLVMTNESEEFFAYFPQWRPLYDSVNEKVLNLVKKVDDLFATVKHLAEGREFFEAVQAHGSYVRLLTVMRKSSLTTCRSVLFTLPERQLLGLLDIK